MMRTIMLTLALACILFAGCKINPAVLQSGGTQDTSKATTKKSQVLEQISEKDNIMPNPGFEEGTEGWAPFGTCQLDVTSEPVHSGESALYVSGRLEKWQGPGINLGDLLESGESYRISAWVALDADQSAEISMTVKRADGAGTKYIQISKQKVKGEEWVQLAGILELEITGEVKELTLYFEGPAPGADFYVDDVAVAK